MRFKNRGILKFDLLQQILTAVKQKAEFYKFFKFFVV